MPEGWTVLDGPAGVQPKSGWTILDEPVAAARQAGGTTEVLKAPQGTPGLGRVGGSPSMLRDLGARAMMSLFGDTAAEKYEAFRKVYPEGDIVRDPESEELLFRRQPGEQYARIDPNMITESGRLADLPGDVADFVGGIPAAAGATAALIATRGASGLQTLLSAGLGTGAGEGVRQLGQTAAGTQRQTGGEQFGEAVSEAALASAGEAAMKPVIGAVNAVRGGANIALQEGAKAAQRGASKLGLPNLMPGQIALSPIIKRVERQAEALSTNVTAYKIGQEEAAKGRLRKLAIRPGMNWPKPGLLADAIEDEAQRHLNRYTYAPTDSVRAGEAIKKGFEEWNLAARDAVNKSYDQARAAATPTYDMSSVREVAEEVKIGRPGMRERVDPDVDPGTVQLEKSMEKELESAISDIQALDPSLPTVTTPKGRVVDATEQLSAIRQRLWDLKTPNPGERETWEHLRAGKIYNALTKTLRNPIVDDADAAKLWKGAAEAAHARFNVWDKAALRDIAKTQRPSAYAAGLLSRNSVDDINEIKAVLPQARWGEFQDYAATELLRDPNLLKNLDEPTLKAVFNARELSTLRTLRTELDNMAAPRLRELANAGFGGRQLITEFMGTATPASTAALVRSVKGTTEAMRELKASIIDAAMGAAVKSRTLGGLDPVAFNAFMAKATDLGLTRLFSSSERQALQSLRDYMVFAGRQTDSGTQLVTAGIAAKLAHAGLEAISQVVHSAGIGRLMMRPEVQRFLVGTGASRNPLTMMRALGSGLAIMSGEADAEATSD